MAREYFKCFHSYREKTKNLTDAEIGRLFRALMQYSETGETPLLPGRESIAFDFIADEIRRDATAYDQLCKQNAQNRAQQTTTVNDRRRPSTTVDETPRKAWRWEGPLGTPLGLVHWKRASSPVEAGTAGYL